LSWNQLDLFETTDYNIEGEWRYLPSISKKISDKGINAETVSLKSRCKRSCADAQLFSHQISTSKRRKVHFTNGFNQLITSSAPMGPSWRANSCAFDSVISIIFNAWKYRSAMIS
jgi:hypothetical protein